ncbi:MAG: hypothetical protein MUC47_05155 [Candidatus Kapabacteria bacterium]|jgi:diaminopimelate epimerase|nr:hypothetical protein [Candidatus Kapabacteria bacterium]
MRTPLISVHHWSGAGNRFVIVDGRTNPLTRQEMQLMSPSLCNRTALGLLDAEGAMLLRSVTSDTIVADFFNPDGSFGAMCGNGGRAIVNFAQSTVTFRLNHPIHLHFSDMAYLATILPDKSVTISFPEPQCLRLHPAGSLEGVDRDVTEVQVGNDHAVVRADPTSFDPRVLRHHPAFPRGANVSMLSQDEFGIWHIATFERGVEHITAACGTGAIASAIALWSQGLVARDVTLIPPSGRAISVFLHGDGTHVSSVDLTGDALLDHPPTPFNTTTLRYQSHDPSRS